MKKRRGVCYNKQENEKLRAGREALFSIPGSGKGNQAMKRILSVLLCAALLAGCGSLNLTPSRPQEEQTPHPGAHPSVGFSE